VDSDVEENEELEENHRPEGEHGHQKSENEGFGHGADGRGMHGEDIL